MKRFEIWFKNCGILRHWAYFQYVFFHKLYVYQEGRKLGLSRWMLFWPDWDKFLPDEWFPYARFFYKPDGRKYGRCAPKDKGYSKPTDTSDQAFDYAWLLHQKRNKHHWQWWILPEDSGGVKIFEMPDVYRREMLADWRGAGRAQLRFAELERQQRIKYQNEIGQQSFTAGPRIEYNSTTTMEWYIENMTKMQLAQETRAWIEQQLGMPSQETYAYQI